MLADLLIHDSAVISVCERSLRRPVRVAPPVATPADLSGLVLGSVSPSAAADVVGGALPADRHRASVATLAHGLAVGMAFEAALVEGLRRLAELLPPSSPAAAFVGREIAEELEHSRVFAAWSTMLGVPPERSIEQHRRRFARYFDGRVEVMLLATLVGESVIDHGQRRLAHSTGCPPRLLELLMYHSADEAAHVRFAGSCLAAVVADDPAARRRCELLAGPLVVRSATVFYDDVGPVAGALGIDERTLGADPAVRSSLRGSVTSAADLVRGRLRRAGLGTEIVDAMVRRELVAVGE